MIANADTNDDKHLIPQGQYGTLFAPDSRSYSWVFSVYNWGGLPQTARICDVGGGNGHLLADVVKMFPNIRLVIQDLPLTREQGLEVRFIPLPSIKTLHKFRLNI